MFCVKRDIHRRPWAVRSTHLDHLHGSADGLDLGHRPPHFVHVVHHSCILGDLRTAEHSTAQSASHHSMQSTSKHSAGDMEQHGGAQSGLKKSCVLLAHLLVGDVLWQLDVRSSCTKHFLLVEQRVVNHMTGVLFKRFHEATLHSQVHVAAGETIDACSCQSPEGDLHVENRWRHLHLGAPLQPS